MFEYVIVGYGTVGKVTEHMLGFSKATTYDLLEESGADIIGGPVPKASRTYFICTHENNTPEALVMIRETDPNAFIVIRSTIMPGFCDIFSEPDSPVIHVPAFHKETDPIEDFVKRIKYIVVGARDPNHYNLMKIAFSHNFKLFILTDPNTSALAKLVNNTRLALGVSFWNEISRMSDIFDADIEEVVNVVCADKRHLRHGTKFFGEPWEGKCLPKDVDSLLRLVDLYNGTLLKSIKESNDKLRKEIADEKHFTENF